MSFFIKKNNMIKTSVVKYVNPTKDNPKKPYTKKEDTQVNDVELSAKNEWRKQRVVKDFIDLSINPRKIFKGFLERGILTRTHGK